jgi:hypothetical protein
MPDPSQSLPLRGSVVEYGRTDCACREVIDKDGFTETSLVRISRLFEEPTYLTFAKRLAVSEVPKRAKPRERAGPFADERLVRAISGRRCNGESDAHPDEKHWCDNSVGR